MNSFLNKFYYKKTSNDEITHTRISSSELNIQMYWNKMSGKRIVKAGTPLAQLIPLTEKEYSFEVRDKNENDTKWLKKRKYLNAYSFIFNRNKAKEAYHRQYHKLKGLLSWLN